MRKLLPFPHSQQRREGGTALLALLCGFSSSSAFGSVGFGSVLCSASLASMPSSPVASGDASGFSAEQLDGYTADELKRLVKERGLPWPDRNDPARAARGRSVGSGLVKADFIAALMTPDGSAAPGPGPGPPVHHKYDIVEYDDPVSGRWLPAVVSGFNGSTGDYSVRFRAAGTSAGAGSVDASGVAADQLRAPPVRQRDEDAAGPAARPAQRQRTASAAGQPSDGSESEEDIVHYDRTTQHPSRRDELIAQLQGRPEERGAGEGASADGGAQRGGGDSAQGGAGDSVSGRSSLIVPNRTLAAGEVGYVADFVETPAHVESACFSGTVVVGDDGALAFRRGRCADPTSVPDYYSGAARLRRYMLDNKRWPVDDGYLEVYVSRICGWSRHFTWAAINQYDRTFRRKMHLAGNAGSWRALDASLHAACFLEDPAARLD